MLAVTFAEKGCGHDYELKVDDEHQPSRAELRAHLAAHLDPRVWAALEPKLAA